MPVVRSVGRRFDGRADAARDVTFVNRTSEALSSFWVNNDCREESRFAVEPRSQVTQSSYVTHPWRLRSATTLALDLDVPPGNAVEET